jgi:hypothetical protein
MTLTEFNQKMAEFSTICEYFESGRQRMEIGCDFINQEALDSETRLLMATKLYAELPSLVASYMKLKLALEAVITPPVEPPVEPPAE